MNSSQASEKPSQSTKQTSEAPAKKRKRKEKKKAPGKAKGALSLLIQYDSDSQSSCGTHTESDDSSGHSTSPVSGTLSPVVMETTDNSRYQTSGGLPGQSHDVSANGSLQINGAGVSSKSGETVVHKKRPSNGKSPVEKKKSKGGGNHQTNANPASPFVNLNDTVVSMQQLKSVSPGVSMPANYQPYPAGYPSYTPPGQHGYVMPGFPLPTSTLTFTPGGHPHAQYSASLPPQYYTGESHPGPPGYSTSPRAYFPQWRTSYAPMQCQPSTFNYSNNGNNSNNAYR